MNLLQEDQTTDLEQIIGLSRRGFISAGALCGAAMFLGGSLLSRSALADGVRAASSPLLGFNSIDAAPTDTLTLPPGSRASVLLSWGPPLRAPGPASAIRFCAPGPSPGPRLRERACRAPVRGTTGCDQIGCVRVFSQASASPASNGDKRSRTCA